MAGAEAEAAVDEGGPRCRALLIACDEFVDATDMAPIGENNLKIMERMLEQDTRGFEVKRQYGITSSKEALEHALLWAFADAEEGDISLLYLSTHGEFVTSHNNPHGILLLSDGSLEDAVTAQELNEMLDKIPGTKVLLVDACNSGALVGKGVSPDVGSARVAKTFQTAEYKVLTSSGASEPSWYLQPTLEHAPPGSSYFTTALAVGAGVIGGYAADANRDGTITLREMYDHLWTAQASSVVQMYPQDDGFPLLVYDKAALLEQPHGELTGFVFGPMTLDAQTPELTFSYTATAATRVAYRITYLRNGEWDWINGKTLRDTSEQKEGEDATGDISPGRKEVHLPLTEVLPEGWTYAMIHVMTLGDMEEGKQPFIYASRVFSAYETGADPNLAVRTSLRWERRYNSELEVFVRHAVPCRLTVSVQDAQGEVVRRLATSRATRPQALTPEGSLLYWNGLDTDGNMAEPGEYSIRVETAIGEQTYEAECKVVIE